MNIGIVCYPTFGGSGVVATELGKALAAQGNKVHFITYQMPVRLASLTSNLFYHEVNVSDYPLFDYPPYELVLTSKLVNVVENEKLDILHVHYAIPHASAALAAKAILAQKGIHIPVVTTLHGTDITLVGKDPSFEPVITYAINNSDVVTAVSQSLVEDTKRFFKVNREIKTIPNFLCMDKMDKARMGKCKKSQFAEEHEKLLVHVSNFRPVKRIDDVVQIFYRVQQQMPAKLLMAGDGPERTSAEYLCRKLGISDKVIFVGKVKNPLEVLCMSDLFLLPSETESFGLAALEAMGLGVPVISSNSGGLPEVNIHGKTGYTANVGDVDAMAEHAVALLKDEVLYARIQKGALDQAASFDISSILPQYLSIYEQFKTALIK